MFFKFSHFCFQNALEQITSCSFQEFSLFISSRHSRIIWQLIEGLISSFLTKDIKDPTGVSQTDPKMRKTYRLGNINNV